MNQQWQHLIEKKNQHEAQEEIESIDSENV